LAELASGNVEVVVNCQVLTEGWDCPEVGCIVLAWPTKSLVLFRQMVGRVLRPAPGKTDAIILDHSGAVFQHGFVDDPIEWTLNEDERAENRAHSGRGQYGGTPALTTCPECAAVRLQGQPCPVCHWRPVPKPRRVDVSDGTLGVVDRDRRVTVAAPDRGSFFRQLLGIATERNYQRGWAAHKFREKFGDWPPRSLQYASPEQPDQATRAWVRSRAIAYAKATEVQRAAAAP
jgi:DNA repair protein RadD